MNGRLYDPLLHRFLSPDNYIQDASNTQNFNRYGYVLNNPLKYTDKNGHFFFLIPIIAAAVFGTANLAIQASNGEVHNFWDGLKAFGSGAIAGAAIATGVGAGLGVPILGPVLVGAEYSIAGMAAVGTVAGIVKGAATGDWSLLAKTGKIAGGMFYLNSKRNFFGETLEGLSRFSWEFLQTTVGEDYTQLRNATGNVDRVDYFDGVTFATAENTDGKNPGVSIGNYVNIEIVDKINGKFADRVLSDPLYMHEYGHTIDSETFGLSYLFVIGIPSLFSKNDPIPGEPREVGTHDFLWYEMRATRNAAGYFYKHYGVDWDQNETYYPTHKR